MRARRRRHVTLAIPTSHITLHCAKASHRCAACSARATQIARTIARVRNTRRLAASESELAARQTGRRHVVNGFIPARVLNTALAWNTDSPTLTPSPRYLRARAHNAEQVAPIRVAGHVPEPRDGLSHRETSTANIRRPLTRAWSTDCLAAAESEVASRTAVRARRYIGITAIVIRVALNRAKTLDKQSVAEVKAAPIPRTVAGSLLTCRDVAVTTTPTVVASAHVLIDGDLRQAYGVVVPSCSDHAHPTADIIFDIRFRAAAC